MLKYILTDIEGTTTSVSFVYDVLFPYFVENCRTFFAQHTDLTQVKEVFEQIKKEIREQDQKAGTDAEVIEKLLEWTGKDIKDTRLKLMQGLVWKEGYAKGSLKGQVYADVPPCLEKWKQAGFRLGVYSSGSVDAQKLLFGHSDFGDLTLYFSDYFDTRIGHKREIQSYLNIARELGLAGREILFLSDANEELDAAMEAGYNTLKLAREVPEANMRHRVVSDFHQINL